MSPISHNIRKYLVKKNEIFTCALWGIRNKTKAQGKETIFFPPEADQPQAEKSHPTLVKVPVKKEAKTIR